MHQGNRLSFISSSSLRRQRNHRKGIPGKLGMQLEGWMRVGHQRLGKPPTQIGLDQAIASSAWVTRTK